MNPSIVLLALLLSLDVTRGLVRSGLGQAPIVITGATNTTPIVLTTATPHGVPLAQDGIPQPAHFVVAGVLGNTAANNIDAMPRSETLGENLAVQATAIDETHLSLEAVNADGFIAPLAGNGAYTGGGTLTAALPNLRILLGRQYVAQLDSAPRIVMVPVRHKYGPMAVYNRNTGNATERRAQIAQRSIATRTILFEVHVWGQAIPRNPDFDFDATMALETQVLQSAHLLAPGSREFSDGAWADQVAGATQLAKAGHELVFGLSLPTPVLREALPYANGDVAALQTTLLQLPGSDTTSVSCTG